MTCAEHLFILSTTVTAVQKNVEVRKRGRGGGQLTKICNVMLAILPVHLTAGTNWYIVKLFVLFSVTMLVV